MFNMTLAQYKEHDLVFMLDEDDNFWFIIRHTSSTNHVDAVAFGEGTYAIQQARGLNAFIDNEVIPKATALVRSFFGEVISPPQAGWRADLEASLRVLKFDGNIVEISR